MPVRRTHVSPTMTVLEAARLRERRKHAAALAEQRRIEREQAKQHDSKTYGGRGEMTARVDYRVEQAGNRWACLAGNLAMMCATKEEAEALRKRLIAAAIRQRELDRKRRLIA